MSGLYVEGNWNSYAVYRKEVRVSKFHPDESRALDCMDRMNKEERSRDRNCMCCRTVFRSEGNHNRLCNGCRTRNFDPAFLSGSAVVI